MSGRKFTLQKTNFDVLLRYEEIDGWAHVAKDFPARINKKIAESIAVSLITIGMFQFTEPHIKHSPMRYPDSDEIYALSEQKFILPV